MKHITTIALLVLAGLSAAAGDLEDWLIDAAGQGNLSGVSQMLSRGADVNAQDKYDYTALMLAARNGYTDIVALLKAAGASQT